MTGDRTCRVRVTGRVQGVSYRAWTRAKATDLGLTGWVRNERDGSVSALLSGPPDRVAEMILAMKEGPDVARVAAVDTSENDEQAPDRFEIRR